MTHVFMAAYSKEEVSKLVRSSRITNGYTQQELADITRVSLRSIQRIENGEVLPRLYTLKIIAATLQFSLDQVIMPPGKKAVVYTEKTGLNKSRKIILSVSIAVLMLLLTSAFLFQATKFPETDFERFLLFAGVVTIYSFILMRIWK